MPFLHSGHRARLRSRFEKTPENLAEYELLELALAYAIPRRDTKPLAKALLKRFRNLAGVLEAPVSGLRGIPGIGPSASGLLALFKPVCAAYLKSRLGSRFHPAHPEAVADYCRAALSGKGHEVVLAIFVDARNRLVEEKTLSLGTIDESPLYPRRLVEEALASKAAGFILVHNHPSGCVEPSPADKALTRRILKVAQSLDLRFLDHVIVGGEGWYSFRKEGLLERLTDAALARI